MRQPIFLAAFLFATFNASSAFAWSDLRHRVICQIAYEELKPEIKTRVDALIAIDPKFRTFADGCTWPDVFPRQRPPEHYVDLSRSAKGIEPQHPCPLADRCVISATLSARALNPSLSIIASGELASTESKLLQAGADKVVLPTHIGGERIAELLLYQESARFMESLERSHGFQRALHNFGIELQMVTVAPESPAVRMTVGRRRIRTLTRLAAATWGRFLMCFCAVSQTSSSRASRLRLERWPGSSPWASRNVWAAGRPSPFSMERKAHSAIGHLAQNRNHAQFLQTESR